MNDLRYAFRTLRRQPGVGLVVVLTLAVGLGASTALFTFLAEEHWTRVHAPDVERLFFVRTGSAEKPFGNSSYRNALLYQETLADLGELSPWAFVGAILTPPAGDETRESTFGLGSGVSPEHFRLFGVHGGRSGQRLALGRDFLPEEFEPGGPRVAIVDHTYWSRRLGADPDIVGKTLRFNSLPFTVVGVAPRGFENTGLPHQIYVPMSRLDELSRVPRLDNPKIRNFTSLFRVSADLPVADARAQAEARLAVVAERLDAEDPRPHGRARHVRLVPVEEGVTALDREDLILVGAVGLLLLLASANVANLLLARATGRRREIAVLVAVGASRGRIARHLLVESLVLALAGGVFGLVINRLLTGLMAPLYQAMPIGYGGLWEGNQWRQIDERVLLFALGASLLTGVLFGLAPIAHGLRTDLVSALKASVPGAAPGPGLSARQVLVVAQVTLSTVLVLAAALLVRSLGEMLDRDPGFDIDHQVLMALAASPRIDDPLERREAQRRIYEQGRLQLARLPGVEAATYGSSIPGSLRTETVIELPDRPGERLETDWVLTGPDYFETFGIERLRGRAFDRRDRAGAAGVAIVNQAFVERFFGGREALGQELRLPDLPTDAAADRFTIVGVVATIQHRPPNETSGPLIYLPYAQGLFAKQAQAAARVQGSPASAIQPTRRAATTAHPDLALLEVGTYDRQLASNLSAERLRSAILSLFGMVGLGLACLGIYSVMSRAVSDRRRELGIRMAVGATVRDVVRLILGEAGRLVVLGVLLGVAGALAAGRWLRSWLFDVAPYDPAILAGLPLMLLVVALSAAWLPAWRAGRVDPTAALHEE